MAIWDDNGVSEYDLIAEDAQKAEELAEEYASASAVVEANDEDLEEISDESAFELTHTESNVIYNARLRLEQAKLYEMLINHNLFEGVEASEEAIKNVQNELKFYIVKRLEILLGLREPTARVSQSTADLPFNEVEIDFLKQLAFKGTFGRSTEEKSEKSVQKQAIKPVQKPNSLVKFKQPSAPKPKVSAEKSPAPQPTKAPSVKQPLPTKKAAPVAKPKVADSGMGRNLTSEEAMEIAKADLKTASKKPFHEMTDKEKAVKIKEVNDRNSRPVAKQSTPWPSANELEMKYMTQQQNRSYSHNQSDQFNLVLANALAAQKNRGE